MNVLPDLGRILFKQSFELREPAVLHVACAIADTLEDLTMR